MPCVLIQRHTNKVRMFVHYLFQFQISNRTILISIQGQCVSIATACMTGVCKFQVCSLRENDRIPFINFHIKHSSPRSLPTLSYARTSFCTSMFTRKEFKKNNVMQYLKHMMIYIRYSPHFV